MASYQQLAPDSAGKSFGKQSSWYNNVRSHEVISRPSTHLLTQVELYKGTGVGQATRLMLLFEDERDMSQPNSFVSATSQGDEMLQLRSDSQSASESDSQEFYEQNQ